MLLVTINLKNNKKIYKIYRNFNIIKFNNNIFFLKKYLILNILLIIINKKNKFYIRFLNNISLYLIKDRIIIII